MKGKSGSTIILGKSRNGSPKLEEGLKNDDQKRKGDWGQGIAGWKKIETNKKGIRVYVDGENTTRGVP